MKKAETGYQKAVSVMEISDSARLLSLSEVAGGMV